MFSKDTLICRCWNKLSCVIIDEWVIFYLHSLFKLRLMRWCHDLLQSQRFISVSIVSASSKHSENSDYMNVWLECFFNWHHDISYWQWSCWCKLVSCHIVTLVINFKVFLFTKLRIVFIWVLVKLSRLSNMCWLTYRFCRDWRLCLTAVCDILKWYVIWGINRLSLIE